MSVRPARPPGFGLGAGWGRIAGNIAIIVALLGAASFLPPDTAVSERKRAGTLRLCLPDATLPGTAEAEATAARAASTIGVHLVVNRLPAIGRDFNVRNWGLSRAQCDLVAPVIDGAATRGLLQTVALGPAQGWMATETHPTAPGPGWRVGIYPGSAGLDRLQLSGWLRGMRAQVTVEPTPQTLAAALASGRIDAAITGSGTSVPVPGATSRWLTDLAPGVPQTLGPQRLAVGLWKGEATLRRVVVKAAAAPTPSSSRPTPEATTVFAK